MKNQSQKQDKSLSVNVEFQTPLHQTSQSDVIEKGSAFLPSWWDEIVIILGNSQLITSLSLPSATFNIETNHNLHKCVKQKMKYSIKSCSQIIPQSACHILPPFKKLKIVTLS